MLILFVNSSGPNLDDAESGENGHDDSHSNGTASAKPKSAQQKTGEALLKHILNNELVEGASYSFR